MSFTVVISITWSLSCFVNIITTRSNSVTVILLLCGNEWGHLRSALASFPCAERPPHTAHSNSLIVPACGKQSSTKACAYQHALSRNEHTDIILIMSWMLSGERSGVLLTNMIWCNMLYLSSASLQEGALKLTVGPCEAIRKRTCLKGVHKAEAKAGYEATSDFVIRLATRVAAFSVLLEGRNN